MQLSVLMESELLQWIDALRMGFQILAITLLSLCLLFVWRGQVPPLLRRLLRGAGLLWPLAYFYTLRTMPNLSLFEQFFGGIFPALCLLVLPELLDISILGIHALLGHSPALPPREPLLKREIAPLKPIPPRQPKRGPGLLWSRSRRRQQKQVERGHLAQTLQRR